MRPNEALTRNPHRPGPAVPVLVAMVLFLALAATQATAQTGGYLLDWFTIDNGGAVSAAAPSGYTLNGTIGQPDANSGTSSGAYALSGGFWSRPPASPTAVTVAGFAATARPGSIRLSWTSFDTGEITGFNLYRRTGSGQSFVRINASLIYAQPPDPAGAAYTWTDSTVQPGQAYQYRLEAVSATGGSLMFGPIESGQPYYFWLPALVKP